MKVFSVAILVAVLALTAAPVSAQRSGNPYTAEGLALPRDHQYERYDGSNATYSRVEPSQVPALVRQKVPVYDRTARAWVFRPQDGINPRYASSGSGSRDVVTGEGLVLPRDRQYERYDPTNGTYTRVDVGQVPALVRQKVGVYDRTGRAWVYRTQDGINPAYSATAPGRRSSTGSAEWPRAHGRVDSVQGDTLQLRADDGRMLTVDLSPVNREIRQALQQGEGVTVIGHDGTGPNRLRAQYVQQDSSDPSRGGSIAPSASPRR
jgi:hypothetical protein